MRHRCTKTFTHELGLSSAFRQWRAHSHCRYLHGYALSFRIVFGATELDGNGWVIDFGGLRWLKEWLADLFDHKTLVAADDPALPWFRDGAKAGVIDMVIIDHTGCEAFARLVHEKVDQWCAAEGMDRGLHVVEVECREHGANGATVMS